MNCKKCKVCSWLYMRNYIKELWGSLLEDTGGGYCLLKEAANKNSEKG